jgi:ABC-type ATPase involved in cell division
MGPTIRRVQKPDLRSLLPEFTVLDNVMLPMRQLARQGRTVIAVTHDEGLAATAQRRVQLVDGRVVRDGVQG